MHLPTDFDEGDDTNHGWIEFGRGEEGIHLLRQPEIRKVKPQEGLMVTFPGYFWHNTISLKSTQERICIAFDVQSTKGWGEEVFIAMVE